MVKKGVGSGAVQQKQEQDIGDYELNTKKGGKSRRTQKIIKDQEMFGEPPSDTALQSILKQRLGLK